MKALKFLEKGAIGPTSGFEWPVPKGKPGKWVSVPGDLVECKRGIHACTLNQALEWLQPECYVIQLGGETIVGDRKIVARKGRLLYRTPLDERALRLFAADCAEHVLHVFEQERPDDMRPRQAIQAVRGFADGKITDAAQDAAWAAARDAGRDAAWAAARDAGRAAAWAAARDAAWAAAQDAARAAAQDTARAAARAAAQAAARDAAWAAAQDAAWAAAQDAAWDAERRWQIRRLKHYLKLPKGWDA